MSDSPLILGRTLRSSTTTFTFGCTQGRDDQPSFGELVQAQVGPSTVFGVVYEVLTQDDPFVRQIIAASDELEPEKIADMRQRRQSPVEITALAIAYRQGERIHQRIPPRPPATLEPIYACQQEEVREVLGQWDYFRMVLNNAQCPAEELLAACVRHAARAQLPGQREAFLLAAGRELACILAGDPARLDAILRRLVESEL